LADYKVDISFLQAELAEVDFKQQEYNAGCPLSGSADVEMADGPSNEENLLIKQSLSRTTSVRSLTGRGTLSKT